MVAGAEGVLGAVGLLGAEAGDEGFEAAVAHGGDGGDGAVPGAGEAGPVEEGEGKAEGGVDGEEGLVGRMCEHGVERGEGGVRFEAIDGEQVGGVIECGVREPERVDAAGGTREVDAEEAHGGDC